MAKIRAHGAVVSDAVTAHGTKYRLMSDGYVLANYGGGWKVHSKAVRFAVRGCTIGGEPLREAVRLFEEFAYRVAAEVTHSSLSF